MESDVHHSHTCACGAAVARLPPTELTRVQFPAGAFVLLVYLSLTSLHEHYAGVLGVTNTAMRELEQNKS